MLLLPAVANAPQFSVAALPGAVGPTPVAPGLKLAPVPAGIEKQLAQAGPNVADGFPTETIPGTADATGMRLSNPQGLKSTVNFELNAPLIGVLSDHS